MLRPEAVKMITSFGRTLRAMFPNISYTLSGEEVVEVSIENSEGAPLLLFQVDDDIVSLRFGGNLYQQVETIYSWETLTELLVIYIALVYPIYATQISISRFLSAIFGLKIRNWADLLGRLLYGLDVQSSKVGNTFFLDQFTIEANSTEVILGGPIEASREFVSELSLCKTVLSFFSIILQSLDLEVVLWDDDSAIIETESVSEEAAPASPTIANDIDLDIPSPDAGEIEGSDATESELDVPDEEALE